MPEEELRRQQNVIQSSHVGVVCVTQCTVDIETDRLYSRQVQRHVYFSAALPMDTSVSYTPVSFVITHST
jgi:hypothetical protein